MVCDARAQSTVSTNEMKELQEREVHKDAITEKRRTESSTRGKFENIDEVHKDEVHSMHDRDLYIEKTEHSTHAKHMRVCRNPRVSTLKATQ